MAAGIREPPGCSPRTAPGADALVEAWFAQFAGMPREQLSFRYELLGDEQGRIVAYRRGCWERATDAHPRNLLSEIGYTREGERIFPPYHGYFNAEGKAPIGW